MSSPGTFFGLEIARRGLAAHQKSLEVTGHNISNANTPGYSRQEAVHTAGIPYPAPGAGSGTSAGQLGSGVQIETIRRIRNEYLDTQVRDSTSAQSYWESKTEIMEQIESIFPEPDGRGIQEVMLNFFSDWQDFNNTPQDTGIMKAVVESGKELARLFRDSHNQLSNVDKSIVFDIDNATGKIQGGKMYDMAAEINELATRIKDVTESIISVKKKGQQPNDLLDTRDRLLEQLSRFGPVKVEDIIDGQGNETGGINVSLFGASIIHTDANMEINQEQVGVSYHDLGDSDKLNDEIFLDIGTKGVNLNERIDNGTGKLVGTVSAWRENNKMIEQLDQLARSLGDAVNAVYDPDNPDYPQNFWVYTDSNGSQVAGDNRTAGQIYVHQDIIDNPENLDGTEALGVARLRNQTRVMTGRQEAVNGADWNLSITADNQAPILEGFTFVFGADNSGTVAYSDFDDVNKTITIRADWDGSNVDAPTLSEIEDTINKAFADNDYSANVSLGVDGGDFSAADIGGAEFTIQLEDTLNLDGVTLEGAYQGFIAGLGSKTKSAQNMQQNQDAILAQIKNIQQSASGVSLDEELSRMIQFQYGYQASARVMNVMDGILDTLINRMAV